MKLNSYYLHAIDCQNGNPFDGIHSIEVLKEILNRYSAGIVENNKID